MVYARLFLLVLLTAFAAREGLALGAVPEAELRKELLAHRLDVPELKAIEREASRRGLRVFLYGGGLAALAEHAKQRLSGDPHESRLAYELSNFLTPEQDLDFAVTRVDGKAESVAEIDGFRDWLRSWGEREAAGLRADVSGLRTGAHGKPALEQDPDFLLQHNDSLSVARLELGSPPAGEEALRDLHPRAHFLSDVAADRITFLFSPSHAQTARFKEGINPPILSAVRALEKQFRYGGTIDEKGAAEIEKIVKDWDPASVKLDSYVARYLAGRSNRLVRNARDPVLAFQVLDHLGLRQKLLALPGADANVVGSFAWWLSREPLPERAAGAATGRTAGDLKLKYAVHWTNEDGFVGINNLYSSTPRLFASREGKAGETAALGKGFYTFYNTEERFRQVRSSARMVRFNIDPTAREGVDFVLEPATYTAVWRSAWPLRLANGDAFLLPQLTHYSATQRERVRELIKQALGEPGKEAEGIPGLMEQYAQGSPAFWQEARAVLTERFGAVAPKEIAEIILQQSNPLYLPARKALFSFVEPSNLLQLYGPQGYRYEPTDQIVLEKLEANPNYRTKPEEILDLARMFSGEREKLRELYRLGAARMSEGEALRMWSLMPDLDQLYGGAVPQRATLWALRKHFAGTLSDGDEKILKSIVVDKGESKSAWFHFLTKGPDWTRADRIRLFLYFRKYEISPEYRGITAVGLDWHFRYEDSLKAPLALDLDEALSLAQYAPPSERAEFFQRYLRRGTPTDLPGLLAKAGGKWNSLEESFTRALGRELGRWAPNLSETEAQAVFDSWARLPAETRNDLFAYAWASRGKLGFLVRDRIAKDPSFTLSPGALIGSWFSDRASSVDSAEGKQVLEAWARQLKLGLDSGRTDYLQAFEQIAREDDHAEFPALLELLKRESPPADRALSDVLRSQRSPGRPLDGHELHEETRRLLYDHPEWKPMATRFPVPAGCGNFFSRLLGI